MAPPFEQRGRVANEYIKALKELWTKENPTFRGKYCNFSEITFLPKPVQRPHIPIWIGGHSDQALRRAAEFGDGWHPIGGVPAIPLEPPDLSQRLKTLARYAHSAGRNPQDIRIAFKASLYDRGTEAVPGKRRRFTGTAEQIAADGREYQKAGVDCLILDARTGDPIQTLERLEWLAKEVLPRIQ